MKAQPLLDRAERENKRRPLPLANHVLCIVRVSVAPVGCFDEPCDLPKGHGLGQVRNSKLFAPSGILQNGLARALAGD